MLGDTQLKQSSSSAWIESFVISLLFIFLSELLHDPLTLESPFPWIWFAPVLIALRYGLWASQFSLVLLLGSYFYQVQPSLIDVHLELFILGGLLLTILCVLFQSSGRKKVRDSEEVSNYLQTRIQSIAYAYKVVSLAYQRIEQNYIIKPVTIRSSLANLRELLANSHEPAPKSTLDRFLNIVALQCSIEIAAIYPVKNNKMNPKPIVSIGNITSPDPNTYLIQECLENSVLTYIKAKDLDNSHRSPLLVVAPFLDEQGIYALLIVESMPFLSLTDDMIETLNLLLQYYLEGHVVRNAELIIQEYPDCPVDFANELQRLTNLYNHTKQDSVVVAFLLLESPQQKDYLFRLKQEKRGIDTPWEKSIGKNIILSILMPITYQAGVEGFKFRMNTILENEFGTELNQDNIRFKSCQVSSFNNPLKLLQYLLQIS